MTIAAFLLLVPSLHRETLSVPAGSPAAATVTVTAPNGGETLYPNATFTIRWTATGVYAQNLYYSLDAGATWTKFWSPYATTRSYNWKPVCAATTQGRIKVEVMNAAANWISDISNGNFIIRSPTDTQLPTVKFNSVAIANDGLTFTAGTTLPIFWTATDNVCVTSLDLYLSIDGGVSFAPVMTGLTNLPGKDYNSFEWTVPDISTTQARLKLVAHDLIGNVGTAISGTHPILGSGGDTTAPTVEVVQPNGGSVQAGSQYPIEWTALDNFGITSQDVLYSSDSGATFTPIATNLAGNVFSYTWTVPTATTTAGRIKVVARDSAGNVGSDTSDSDFTIAPVVPPSITITSPRTGETYFIGSPLTIQWNFVNVTGNVEIMLSRSSGTTYNETIVASTPNTGSFTWTVSQPATSQAKIRIVSLNDFTVRDFSPTFTISPPPENVAITSTSFTSATAGIGGQTEFQVNVSHSQGLVGQPITVTIRRSSTSAACVVSSPVGGEPEATQTKTGASSRQLTFTFPITLGTIESSACPGTVEYEASVAAPGITPLAAPITTLTIQPSRLVSFTEFAKEWITLDDPVTLMVRVNYSAGQSSESVTVQLASNPAVTPSCLMPSLSPAQTKSIPGSSSGTLEFSFTVSVPKASTTCGGRLGIQASFVNPPASRTVLLEGADWGDDIPVGTVTLCNLSKVSA